MSTRHLVDPELLPGLEMFPKFAFDAESLPTIRTMMDQMGTGPLAAEGFAGTIERVLLPSPEGHDVPVIVHRPDALPDKAPAILHIHGGGYVIGSAVVSVPSNAATAGTLGCLVVSVDYRLAPETAHPGPVEDCYTALAWMAQNAEALGIDAARIAVSGESAGGGLAAALCLLARDRGGPAVCFQHLIFPMLDDRTTRESAGPQTGEFVWTPESNRFGWSALLGEPAGGQGISPYAAPARATDLSGLPPAFLSVGALDLFLAEDMDYARRLNEAGVPAELHVYPGAFHGFGIAAEARVSRQSAADSLAALRRALHG